MRHFINTRLQFLSVVILSKTNVQVFRFNDRRNHTYDGWQCSRRNLSDLRQKLAQEKNPKLGPSISTDFWHFGQEQTLTWTSVKFVFHKVVDENDLEKKISGNIFLMTSYVRLFTSLTLAHNNNNQDNRRRRTSWGARKLSPNNISSKRYLVNVLLGSCFKVSTLDVMLHQEWFFYNGCYSLVICFFKFFVRLFRPLFFEHIY